MRVAICSVGAELTSGETTDTNAVWLSQRLGEVGVEVACHVTVPDEHELIVDALRWLVECSDAVLVGGGLGPTPDDITREAVADLVGVPLERRDALVAAIRRRFHDYGVHMSDANLRQADVPAGAVAFAPVGTAPGFRVDAPRRDGTPCVVYVLPGVPSELEEMTREHVLPDLLERGGGEATVTRVVHVTGMGESAIVDELRPLLEELADRTEVRTAFLASRGEVRVEVTGRGATPDVAHGVVGPVIEEVVHRLGEAVAGVDDERMEESVARLLRRTGRSVATAESCTAGLVAAKLASVPGASDYLRGGVTAYATETKAEVLGVPREILDEHGPCSQPTVEAMAQRARALLDADLGLAVVCVAGPASQDGLPVGTTMWALATVEDVRSWHRVVPGDRATITERAAVATLEALRRHLLAEVDR